ncbi:MAG: hypothetical protein HC838_01935 [Spirulinaceae cyanobacterium RM2_2_10]|nr:hypothetical protein [Spirulinaceae cyanobacterium RM2_2_10]
MPSDGRSVSGYAWRPRDCSPHLTPMLALTFLSLGFGIIAFGFRTRDEVYQLAATIAASLSLVLGLIFAPPLFQVSLEIASIAAVFSLCMRCVKNSCGEPPA